MKVKLSLVLSFLLAVSFCGSAQDFDDIYYNSSKSKKKEEKNTVKQNKTVNTDEYAASLANTNSYTFDDAGSTRDVDEYNRRYSGVQYESSINDTLATDRGTDFVYTDRIRRFHNPSVITESSDPELAELYYVSTTPSVNLIIGTPSYCWDPFRYDWYYPSYSWHVGWYGPGWYSPFYSWNWNWSFGWGWHSHVHHPWWGPGPAFYPGHAPAMGGGNYRPALNRGGRRPFGNGTIAGGSNVGRRPVSTAGNRGNTIGTGSNTGRRPSSVKVNNSGNRGNRPSVNNSSNSNSSRRPAVRQSTNSSRRESSDSYNNYNNSSRSSHRSSGYSSGGSRGGFGGGGYSGGGGSRGGGRRR